MVEVGFRELTNLDVAVLLQELLPLVGSRLEKTYQTSQTEFVFRFKGKDGKRDVTIFLPYAVMLTDRAPQEGAEQTNLVLFLRKHLENKVLAGIEQMNFDRILVFDFGESKIVIELFRKGNLILTDASGKILALQRVEGAKDRIIRNGAVYAAPKMKKAEPTIDAVRDVLAKDWKDEKAIVVITRNINVPAFYMNELLNARNIDPKTQFDKLTPKEKEIIASEIHEFVRELTEKMKVVLRTDGTYLLTELDPGIDDKVYPSFSALLAELHASGKKEAKKVASGSAAEKARKKLKHQEDRLAQLLKEVDEEKTKGEWIKSHVHEVEELIKEYKIIKKGGNKDELESFLKKHKATVGKNGIEIETKE
jgi:predicted ribosome quality control (RQC) complex YloA/Tae2 family protein